MKIKIILTSIILIIVLSVFLVFYPLRFDFYDQLKAKQIVDKVIFPTVIFFLGIYIFKMVKNGGVNWRKFPQEILFAIFLFGIVYFSIIRSVLSCGLLFINCTLSEKETVLINGQIINIIKMEGHGKVMSRYEITVNQDRKVYNFESNKLAIENYSVNQNFKKEMNNGFLNIIYK